MSELKQVLEDLVGRIAADHAGDTITDAAEQGVFPTRLWTALADAGVFDILINAGEPGDTDMEDAVAIMRTLGDAASPGPLLDTLLGRHLLSRAGLSSPSGPLALVIDDRIGVLSATEWSPPSGLVIVWPEHVETLVVVRRGPAGATVTAVNPNGLAGRPIQSLAGEPSSLVPAGAGSLCVLEHGEISGTEAFDDIGRAASLLNAGRMVGALEWCLQQCVSYVGERRQFGRAISAFQVVQQHLAQVAGEVVAAGAITDAATLRAGTEGGPALLAAARSRVADSVDLTVALSHQIHGALGFSREFSLNFRTRRLLQWRDAFGSAASWRRELGGSLIGLTYAQVWPTVAAT